MPAEAGCRALRQARTTVQTERNSQEFPGPGAGSSGHVSPAFDKIPILAIRTLRANLESIRMDIRQLEFFLQIANHGGFNRASAHLHIAQSALSRQVQQLENELGVTLFERSGRGVQLTPAGEFMVPRAEALLRQIRQTRDELLTHASVVKGEVVLGLPPSLQIVCAPILRDFTARYPDVFLTVHSGTSIELREQLLNGKVDLAIYGILEPDLVLESHPILRDDVYAIGPNPSLISEPVIDLQTFSTLPLIMTSRPNSLRLLIEQGAAKRNLKLNVTMDVNYIPLMIELIRTGAGYTALPRSAVTQLLDNEEFSSAKLKLITYGWTIGNSRERPLSAAGRQLRTTLQQLMTPPE